MTWRQFRALISLWRMSALVVLGYGAVSVVGGLIAMESNGSRWPSVLGVSLISTAVALVVMILTASGVRGLLGRGRLGAWLIVVAVVAGVARAFTLLGAAKAMALTVGGADVSLIVNSAFSAVVWMGLLALFVAGQDAYRDRYRQFVHQMSDVSPVVDLDRDPEVQHLRSSLASAVAAAESQPSIEQWTQASRTIRAEIDATLRPMSHRLWFGMAEEEPHARWLRVVRDAIATFHVPLRAVVGLWFIGGIVGGVALFGWGQAVLAAGVSAAVLAACVAGARRILGSRENLALGLVAMVVSSFLPIAVSDLVVRVLGWASADSWRDGLVALLWLALLAILMAASSVSLAASDRRAVLALAHSAGGGADRRVSSYLHNSLQAELTGMAMQLEGAARNDDPQAAGAALERVQSLLNRSLSEDLAAFHEDPRARAARVSEAWAGICDVSLSLSPAVEGGPTLAAAVAAVEELISNAVRHTGATRVTVTVLPLAAGDLKVTCHSDTPGEQVSGTGLGSHLLTSLSPSGVDVSADARGAVYVVRVPASRRA